MHNREKKSFSLTYIYIYKIRYKMSVFDLFFSLLNFLEQDQNVHKVIFKLFF